MSAHGTYERIEGRVALRYRRRLHHPAERVWAAVTQPDGLAGWFPCRIEGEQRVGGRLGFVFPEDNPEASQTSEGEVLVLDPPRSFWFTSDAEEMRVNLDPTDGGGCVLTFCDLMPDDYAPGAARTAAGWHVCLDELEVLLDGGPAVAPTHEPTERWRALYTTTSLAVSPTVRRSLAILPKPADIAARPSPSAWSGYGSSQATSVSGWSSTTAWSVSCSPSGPSSSRT